MIGKVVICVNFTVSCIHGKLPNEEFLVCRNLTHKQKEELMCVYYAGQGALTPYHCVDVRGISHGAAAADPS